LFSVNYFECLNDVTYEVENASCNINKQHLQLIKLTIDIQIFLHVKEMILCIIFKSTIMILKIGVKFFNFH
jgi:hypothetical protein